MKRRSHKFEFEGEQFEARELSYRAVCEVKRMTKVGKAAESAPVIISDSILDADGKPLCETADAVGDLPVRYIERFTDEAAKASGLDVKGGAEGKGRPKGKRSTPKR